MTKRCLMAVIDTKVIKKEIRYPGFTRKKYMLLGRRNDNARVWLEQGSFDCGWYYGFGYLEVLNHLSTDINEHYHFESFFEKFGIDKFKEKFKECVLNERELWQLFDLMKTFYTLKEVAELYHQGNSHYTSNVPISLKNKEKYEDVLKEQKQIILAVQGLLGLPEQDNDVILSDP